MARFAFSITTLLMLTALPTFTNAALIFGRASGTPSCFTCPSQDIAGFALGENSDTSGSLFCSYPVTAGGDPNAFFCTYDNSNGALTQDHNAGLCPASADSTSCARRRDDNFKAMKRRAEARAAQPQTSRPQTRNNLLRKKKVKIAA